MLNVIIKLIPVLNLIVDGIFYIVEKAEKYNDNKISKMEKENLEQWPGPSIPNIDTIKAMEVNLSKPMTLNEFKDKYKKIKKL